jgi:hypothetical protein
MRPARLRRWLAAPLVLLAAVVLLVEAWLWDDLARLAAAIGRLPPLRWIEAGIRRLPPWAAVALFVAPSALLLPVKLGAVALMARGHPTLGLLVVFLAKVIGTGLLARLYALTEPQLLSIAWFAWARDRVLAFKARVHEAIRATAVYRAARARVLRLRAAVAALLRHRGAGQWRRAWLAARRLSRRRARL